MLDGIQRSDGSFWLFGYGSLIWRPDLAYVEYAPARLHGWARRFWQGSHDHRGTPDAPGRVATLVRAPQAWCDGAAYRVPPATAPEMLARLDHREKNGYERHDVDLELPRGRRVRALVYRAAPGNFAWLGPEPLGAMAARIAHAHGPSGSNLEYLLQLDRALAELGHPDDHVRALVAAVDASPAARGGTAPASRPSSDARPTESQR